MKVAILSAVTVLDTQLHAGAVADVPRKVAEVLVANGDADASEAAVAYREGAEGGRVIHVGEPDEPEVAHDHKSRKGKH